MRRIAILGITLLWTCLAGCAFFPPRALPDADRLAETFGAGWTLHRIQAHEIDEPSGLVKSPTYPGVFWTHDDSGDEARIFAVTAQGEVLATCRVIGACNVDWEDIAADEAGLLYVADTGNNLGSRRSLVIYAFREPDPRAGDGAVRVDHVLPFEFADRDLVPRWQAWDFDVEALFWMDGALHVLTKHRTDGGARLYRVPREPGLVRPALRPVASFDLHRRTPVVHVTSERPPLCGGLDLAGSVTAADFDARRGILAVLTYRAVYLFRRCRDPDCLFAFLRAIHLDASRTQQAEGIAWDGADLILGNESGYLIRLPGVVEGSYVRYPPHPGPGRPPL